MSLEPGSILHERYRIERQLGQGGMGTVHLAFDERLKIQVAVKENLNLNPTSERQFQREASLLAAARHPNLPRVIDHFILHGHQYLVMDFIEGEDLAARSHDGPAEVADVLRWADEICAGLAYLHGQDPPIIHRDIKPSNIKLQPDGSLILVDFGLAKIYDLSRTSTGARGLTPGFSPPEQYGSGRTDARSDQYSLAATLYALLTGVPPEDGIERMLGSEDLTPPRELNPAIPGPIAQAIVKALSVSADDRFPDIHMFRAALQGEGRKETVPSRSSLQEANAEGVKRPVRWLWPGLGLAGLLGVLIVGGGIAFMLANRPGGGNGSSPTQAPTAPAGVAAAVSPAPTSVEGAGVAEGGTITFTVGERVFRLEARPDAEPEDMSSQLDSLSSGSFDALLNISPDGSWLVFETDRFDPQCRLRGACLALAPSDLSEVELVKPGGDWPDWQGIAAVSAGGDLIVYSGGGGPNERDLWAVTRADGAWNQPTLLTSDSPYAWNHQPSISAQGSRIVFDCGAEPYGASGTAICEVGADGSGFRILVSPEDGPGQTASAALHHPDYSPNGAVIFEADWEGEQIWRFTPGSQEFQLIGSEFNNDNSPCVLPDGRIVSLWLGGSGGHEIKVMNPDGTAHFLALSGTDVVDSGIGCGG